MKMKKAIALGLAVLMIVAASVAGTVAWLQDSTTEVKNTFTPTTVDVELDESDVLDLDMIPGHTIVKDPKAMVVAGSVDSYLFVKVEKSANFDSFMTYEIADGWTELTSATEENYKVYYREVIDASDENDANNIGDQYPILKENKVSVKENVTKQMMDTLTAETYPTLTFTAYATQLYKSNGAKFTPAEAWNIAPDGVLTTP